MFLLILHVLLKSESNIVPLLHGLNVSLTQICPSLPLLSRFNSQYPIAPFSTLIKPVLTISTAVMFTIPPSPLLPWTLSQTLFLPLPPLAFIVPEILTKVALSLIVPPLPPEKILPLFLT